MVALKIVWEMGRDRGIHDDNTFDFDALIGDLLKYFSKTAQKS